MERTTFGQVHLLGEGGSVATLEVMTGGVTVVELERSGIARRRIVTEHNDVRATNHHGE